MADGSTDISTQAHLQAPLPPPPLPVRVPEREPSAEDKLALVSAVIDLLPDFFYVLDHDLRFRYANAGAAGYFNIAREAMIGRRLDELDPNPEQARSFIESGRRVMAEGTARITDNFPYIRPDGSRGLLRLHDFPFTNPRTGEVMLMGLARDITNDRDLDLQRIKSAALQRELELASEVQVSLRPSSTLTAPGLAVAAFAESAVYAGGDFYDWGICPNGHFIFGLGDVTGHGVGPALLASTCRAYARVLVGLGDISSTMAQLNRMMCEDTTEGRFVTFGLVDIEPESFNTSVLSAGQGPIFWMRARAREVVEIMPQLPPLGVIADVEIDPPHLLTLGTGDAVVILSDGVFEAHGPDKSQLGYDKTREAIERCIGQGPERIVEAVVSAVREHAAGTPFADDVTMVAVSRTV